MSETRICVKCERKYIGLDINDSCPYCRIESLERRHRIFDKETEELKDYWRKEAETLQAQLDRVNEAISEPLPENMHYREVEGCSLMAEKVRAALKPVGEKDG